jgi:hypothetical protein
VRTGEEVTLAHGFLALTPRVQARPLYDKETRRESVEAFVVQCVHHRVREENPILVKVAQITQMGNYHVVSNVHVTCCHLHFFLATILIT